MDMITIRTATRGRAPQAFSYQGIGKVTETRELETKAGEKFQIDEVETAGLFESLDSALEATGLSMEEVYSAIADAFNTKQRNEASPAAGVAPHALDSLVAYMVENGIVENDEKELKSWKRRISTAAPVVFDGLSTPAAILWTGLRDKAGRLALKSGYTPELEKPVLEED